MLISAIIVLTTVVGYLLTGYKKKRAAVYSELYEFNERLLLNMKYGKERLQSLSSQFKYIDDVINGKDVLNGEDGIFLKNYAKNLGATDPQSQIDYLNERKNALKKVAEESSREYKKYSSLYIKIALMVGILIAVLLA